MANTKVTQHVIANNAITADQIASAAVTDAKLHATLDLSGKTLTLPATAIPSASTGTTQAASDNSTKLATTAYVTTAISNLVDSSPSSLDTLNELAAALNDDASFSTTVTNSIATKLPLAGGTLTGALTLSGAPTNALHPATKTYTDTADALKLNLSGGTLTGDLILNTTTALQIPAGTTGQRPSAATGQIRWNTTDGALEVYNGSAWTAVGTGSSNKVLDTFTGDGSNATFTLSVTPANEDAIMVFIDGAYQEKSDYTLTNNSLVLDTAPLNNEKIAVHTTTASVHDGTSAVNQQFTATAGQTAFTLSQDPKSENNTQVYINGVYQQKTDYTVVGTTLTFDTGVSVGDIVEVNMFTVATLGNTDTVTEGVGNLYHTTARARGAISVSGNAISYNSSSGVLTANFEESPVFTSTVTTPTLITGAYGASGSAGDGFRLNSTDLYGQVDASDKVRIAVAGNSFFNGGNVGIGSSSPAGKLHVYSGDAGAVTPSSQADDLVVEANTEVGITLMSPDDQSARIRFTSPSTESGDQGGADIFYRQNINKMSMGTVVSGGKLAFKSGAGTETVLLDDGKVGIRRTPNVRLDVDGDSATGGILIKQGAQIAYTPSSAANHRQGITFENTGSGHSYGIGYGQGGKLKFSYFDNSSTYTELASMGGTSGDMNIAGSLILQSGEGLNFSATGDGAGRTSELLDDYEEGTWTPVLEGTTGNPTVSYQYRSGFYIKVGHILFVRFGFRLSARSGGSGVAMVGGLPYTAKSYGSYQQPAIFTNTQGLTTDPDGPCLFYFMDGTSKLQGRLMNNADTVLPLSYFQSGSWCIGSGCYDIS